MTTDPKAKVARDLSTILELAPHLDNQAEHQSNNALMPGGLAMVALGPVANQEAWTHKYEAAEHNGKPTQHIEDEDDSWEPPLQTLCFWSEAWRTELGGEYDNQPTATITTEAAYIRGALEWAWENEPRFGDFAKDIEQARRRIENVLNEGKRDIVSEDVKCLLCDTPVRRRMMSRLGGTKDRREGFPSEGFEDEWWCKGCGKHLTQPEFYMAAAHAETEQADALMERLLANDQ